MTWSSKTSDTNVLFIFGVHWEAWWHRSVFGKMMQELCFIISLAHPGMQHKPGLLTALIKVCSSVPTFSLKAAKMRSSISCMRFCRPAILRSRSAIALRSFPAPGSFLPASASNAAASLAAAASFCSRAAVPKQEWCP